MGKAFEDKLKKCYDLNQPWSFLVEYLETNHYDIEKIKETITGMAYKHYRIFIDSIPGNPFTTWT